MMTCGVSTHDPYKHSTSRYCTSTALLISVEELVSAAKQRRSREMKNDRAVLDLVRVWKGSGIRDKTCTDGEFPPPFIPRSTKQRKSSGAQVKWALQLRRTCTVPAVL